MLFSFQISLGIVFLFSVLPKLRQPRTFAQNVVAYKILPPDAAYLFGLILIPVEIFLAVTFLTNWLINISLPLSLAIFALFLVAVGINLYRGRQISCGCFGDTNKQISNRTLVRLFLLLIAVIWMLLGLVAWIGKDTIEDNRTSVDTVEKETTIAIQPTNTSQVVAIISASPSLVLTPATPSTQSTCTPLFTPVPSVTVTPSLTITPSSTTILAPTFIPLSDEAITTCPVSQPNLDRCPNENYIPLRSGYGNDEGTLFISLYPESIVTFRPDGPGIIYSDGRLGMKFWLYRRVAGDVIFSGRRLDAPSPPMTETMLRGPEDGYGETGFHPARLIFASEGCWEVTAKVEDSSMTFVTLVIFEEDSNY